MGEKVLASISNGSTVLVENVEVWLEVSQTRGLQDWRGSFQLPLGQRLDAGGTFRLETIDGRAGNIMLPSVSFGGGPSTRVTFEGAGPLEVVDQ